MSKSHQSKDNHSKDFHGKEHHLRDHHHVKDHNFKDYHSSEHRSKDQQMNHHHTNDNHFKEHQFNKHGHFQQRFPITKPGLCETSPKFPYRDIRHYVDPCCDFPKKCQIGYTAQLSLSEPHPYIDNCHSPVLPTNHPWFDPSA